MIGGMEKMLASMLGITPEEMQATVGNAIGLLQNLDARLGTIERQVNFLYSQANPGEAQIEGKLLEGSNDVESRAAN